MKLIFVLHVVFTFIYLGTTYGFIVRYTEQHHEVEELPHEGEDYITCICDGQIKRENLPKNSLWNIFESMRKQDFCGPNFSTHVCDLLKTCQRCTAVMEKCSPVANATTYDCLKSSIIRRENFLTNLSNAEDLGSDPGMLLGLPKN